MSLIDDLKHLLAQTSIKPNESEKVITEIIKTYGGQYPYVRLNFAQNCRKKSR